MGRPVNKKYFGLLDDGTNITVNCQVESNIESDSGYILRQRSSRKFLVNDLKTGTKQTPAGVGTGNVGVCTLVDKDHGSLGVNEMSIMGTIPAVGNQVRISRMYNRTCKDFNNNRYSWYISDDSTASVLVLTQI